MVIFWTFHFHKLFTVFTHVYRIYLFVFVWNPGDGLKTEPIPKTSLTFFFVVAAVIFGDTETLQFASSLEYTFPLKLVKCAEKSFSYFPLFFTESNLGHEFRMVATAA